MPLHLELQEQIAAPPEQVFAAIVDIEGAGAWMPNCVRIERLDQGPVAVGSQWRETRKMFGREATEHFEVTDLKANEAVELYVDGTRGSSRKGFYRFRYRLEPTAEGTRLCVDGEIGGMGLFGELLGRLFVGTFRKALVGDLRAMKNHVEGRSGRQGLQELLRGPLAALRVFPGILTELESAPVSGPPAPCPRGARDVTGRPCDFCS